MKWLAGEPLHPMWFDHDGDKTLVNVTAPGKKTQWIRETLQKTLLLLYPENMYHWMSL